MNNLKILQEAYNQFLLPLGGKKVPTPYRINIPFQPDRRKYGKSDPKTLVKDTIEIAKEQNFDLKKASVEEIRKFMLKNKLGIDCSGFVYHLLNFYLQKTDQGSMMEIGFPKASSTNVKILTSRKFTVKVKNMLPGDLIRVNSKKLTPHILIVLDTNLITHSGLSSGIQQLEINKIPESLLNFTYDKKAGDGIYRLRAFIKSALV